MIENMPEADCNEALRPDEIRFGDYVLLPHQHLLLLNANPVALGSRAMGLLIALAERPGELLEKNTLLAQVWPKLVVEECNLRAQVAALRRALGDSGDLIATVAGRGYRFVAPVTYASISRSALHRSSPPGQASGNSAPLAFEITPAQGFATARLFGREELLGILEVELQRQRFVTLTGHAGVGKTSVALALAQRMQPHLPHVCVDLATADGSLAVATLLAQALKLEDQRPEGLKEAPLVRVTRHLTSRQMLLVFDSCEPVLDDTAAFIEAILHTAPRCLALVTSREPLRAEGEFVHDLAPLQAPPDGDELSCVKALSYPAVTLLVDRMVAHNMGYIFTRQDVAHAVALCRKLDGNPLAIEIAAARVRSFGLEQVVEMLDGEMRLQMIGRRTAPPRHRSLGAALDFSYALLSRQAQTMLGELSVFSGSFSLRAVRALIQSDGQDIAETLEHLVDKSLLVSRGHRPVKRYRLLSTTRLYAALKIGSPAEKNRLARRHARWVLDEQKRAVDDLNNLPLHAWIDQYEGEIDSVRAALEWAYSAHGDLTLAAELTLASIPMWSRMGLTDECQAWIKRGLGNGFESTLLPLHQRMPLQTPETRAS
nr:winged helix-turn-helix domain-containing protein [uncultured Pseudomonas sp.]